MMFAVLSNILCMRFVACLVRVVLMGVSPVVWKRMALLIFGGRWYRDLIAFLCRDSIFSHWFDAMLIHAGAEYWKIDVNNESMAS